MGMLVILIAGILAACANLCMRRSIDAGGSARVYLIVQISISCAVGILLNPVRTGNFAVSLSSLGLGIFGGGLLGGMLWCMGRALERGPPGLTFAVVNCATVAPALLLVWFMGQTYYFWHVIGSCLVVLGLFWAGWEAKVPRSKFIWLICVVTAFILHALLLTLLQWRSMHPTQGQWFMPISLAVAGLWQIPGFLREGRQPARSELFWGGVGGGLSGGATFLLILAPFYASNWQVAMLFPAFAVTVVLASSMWGRVLYRERVNWFATGLCTLGIALGCAYS